MSTSFRKNIPNSNTGFKDPKTISPTSINDPSNRLLFYGIKDWRGNLLDVDPESDNVNKIRRFETEEKMRPSVLPKSDSELNENFSSNDPSNFSPYSTIDIYNIFNDSSTNYFKHGILIERQSIGNESGNLYSTPEENNDPVIFGFDLVIDVLTSPLLNGSINDFLKQFSAIEEINSKKAVYQDFIIQFKKLFKTRGDIDVDTSEPFLMNGTGQDIINQVANSDQNNSISYGKKAYMSYYLQKVDGLKELSESNGVGSFKYLTDYRKDKITLHFLEDVSLTMGTLANLYKLLYWSKPNGKSLIPENLLRFDCKIIVSELRNFNRIKASNDRVDVIKDNLSRYVYSLKECQFFFDTRPHEDSINVGGSNAAYQDYSVNFDYKFSSVVYEKWNPSISQYRSYNDSSMWDSNGNQIGVFNDIGTLLSGNGYDKDFLIKNYTNYYSSTETNVETGRETGGELKKIKKIELNKIEIPKKEEIEVIPTNDIKPKPIDDRFGINEKNAEFSNFENQKKLKEARTKTNSDRFGVNKNNAKFNPNKIRLNRIKNDIKLLGIRSARNAAQSFVNSQFALINRSLNKALNAVAGTKGIKPPTNVYYPEETTELSRFFYDVRGQLADFAGDSLSRIFNRRF
jgi:hypothetical protein